MRDDLKPLLGFCCSLVAALASMPAVAQQQEPMGRLFFTPAQRSSLDVARSQRARATLSTEKTEEQAAPVEQSLTYSGMVRRSDGKSTVWINGRPVSEKDALGGAAVVGRVGADGSVSLQVPQSGRRVELKPGQSVELLSGTIEEGYSRKAVTPETKPAANAKGGTGSASDADAKGREERERARIEDAVAQALRDVAAATKATEPPPGPGAKPVETPAPSGTKPAVPGVASPIPDRQPR
jgi:hypothetical protein